VPTVAPCEAEVLKSLGCCLEAVSTEKERVEEPSVQVYDGTERDVVGRHAVISLCALNSAHITSDLSRRL
jgi:hypothetical protein